MKKVLSIIFPDEHPTNEQQALIKATVTDVVNDSSFPRFDIGDAEELLHGQIMQRLGLRAINDPHALDDLVVDSIVLLEERTGFPLSGRVAIKELNHQSVILALKIRDALGLVALLWRIHHCPETLDDNKNAVPC